VWLVGGVVSWGFLCAVDHNVFDGKEEIVFVTTSNLTRDHRSHGVIYCCND
jgi:hypothetical protein